MRKPWQSNNFNHDVPTKPRHPNKQLSMIWEQCFNHLPSIMASVGKRLWWQDRKLDFMMVLLGLILACLAARLFA
jgi:hypothetical protein